MTRLWLTLLALAPGFACARAVGVPDTLAVLAERDVEGLDPHTSGQVWQTQMVLANIYEGLVGLDGQMTLGPRLAKSWSNPDDLTWVFVLQRGVPFQSGGVLDAQDVVFSLERARDDPRSVLRVALAGVDQIRALDDDRVLLRTREPDAALASRLCEVPILSRRFVQQRGENAIAETSCGTGPYALAGRESGRFVDLRRFDAYWGGTPAIPRARFIARSFGAPDQSSLIPRGARLLLWARPGPSASLMSFTPRPAPGLAMLYLSFDLRGGTTPCVRLSRGQKGNPFLDARVRRAVASALDTQAVTSQAGSVALPASQLVPSSVFGFDSSIGSGAGLGMARRLVAATPYREGFDVDLDLRQIHAAFGPPISRALAAIGIRVRENVLPEAMFFQKLAGGGSSFALLRFSCWTGDAQTLFDKSFHSRRPELGYGVFNFSYPESPVPGLDSEIEAARRELNAKHRLARLQAIMRRVLDAGLAVPLAQESYVFFTSPEVAWRPRSDTFVLVRDARINP